MTKNLEAAAQAIATAQTELKAAAVAGIGSDLVSEARSALSFADDLDEKQKQIAQLIKRANAATAQATQPA